MLRRLGTGLTVGVVLALGLGSPAMAATELKQSGVIGDHGTRPSEQGPEAQCGYRQESTIGIWDLRSITVYPLLAAPAAGLLSQKVSWRVTVQSQPIGGSTWTTVARSKTKTGTATDTTSAQYTPTKVGFRGQPDQVYRAVSTLKWLSHGSVSGLLKLWMDTYGTKFGTFLSTTQYMSYCPGQFLE